jgi:hypothetical protein
MKVAELIALLQTMPQDAVVKLARGLDVEDPWSPEVRDVLLNDPAKTAGIHELEVELDNWPPVSVLFPGYPEKD